MYCFSSWGTYRCGVPVSPLGAVYSAVAAAISSKDPWHARHMSFSTFVSSESFCGIATASVNVTRTRTTTIEIIHPFFILCPKNLQITSMPSLPHPERRTGIAVYTMTAAFFNFLSKCGCRSETTVGNRGIRIPAPPIAGKAAGALSHPPAPTPADVWLPPVWSESASCTAFRNRYSP